MAFSEGKKLDFVWMNIFLFFYILFQNLFLTNLKVTEFSLSSLSFLFINLFIYFILFLFFTVVWFQKMVSWKSQAFPQSIFHIPLWKNGDAWLSATS